MPTMKAVIVKDGKGPVENLYVGEIEKPVPGTGEVLVQVLLSISFARFTDTTPNASRWIR